MGEARRRRVNGEYPEFKGNEYREQQTRKLRWLRIKPSNIKKKNYFRRYLGMNAKGNPEERAQDIKK